MIKCYLAKSKLLDFLLEKFPSVFRRASSSFPLISVVPIQRVRYVFFSRLLNLPSFS